MQTGYREAPEPIEPAEKGPYTYLRPFAASRSLPYAGASSLSFHDADRRVTLSYSLNSGTVDGLEFSIGIATTPSITLRGETYTDRKGKDRGLNREVQVGDPAFDDRVYIECDSTDEGVLRVLRPEVRAAILALFDLSISEIQLSDRRASFSIATSDSHDIFEPAHIERFLDASRGLSFIPPTRDVPADNTGGGVGALIVLATIVAVPAMIATSVNFPTERLTLQFLGAVVGWTIWFLSRGAIARASDGHSRSYRTYLFRVSVAFLGLPLMTIALLVGANGAFDRRPERVRRGVVTSITKGEDEEIHVRFEDGTTLSTMRFTGFAEVGSAARGSFHPGALGVEWRDRSIEVSAKARP